MPTRATTIAALATAPAPAGIAVIRVSGPGAREVLARSFRSFKDPAANPRTMIYGSLIAPENGEEIERGLAVFMPGPASYTGEDVVEFQVHGSPLLARRLLRTLFALGVHPAEPGEFTKRAFLNGKLDLLQAEAVCDVINAQGEHALRAAREQLAGRLSGIVDHVAEPLRDTLAELEARIDFPEEDIEPAEIAGCAGTLHGCRDRIAALLRSYEYGRHLKEGFRVLLWGPPNAGKSTLLNLLLREERAIVSEFAGTTRDILEERASIGGYTFVFCDCAGIQESDNPVERIGIERAAQRLDWADLVLWIADSADPVQGWRLLAPRLGQAQRVWLVMNKSDLCAEPLHRDPAPAAVALERSFSLSALRGDGLAALEAALVDAVEAQAGGEPHGAAISNERQRGCLLRADAALHEALQALQHQLPPEIASAELRRALAAMEELVGATTTEDILGRIFSKFCIGK